MATSLSGAAVVPLTTRSSPADAWELMAMGEGVLVRWEPFDGAISQWSQPVAATSQLARQLGDVVTRSGSSGLAGSTLFRVELPAGQTLADLVPAVGGGFRGFISARGSTRIAGQVRLIPVQAGRNAGALALGPAIGLMALSVGAEMVARQQIEAKLDAILRSTQRLEADSLKEKFAALKTGEQALEQGAAALLDQIRIPESVGLGSAVTGIQNVRNMTVGWVSSWEALGRSLAKGASYDQIRRGLDGVAVGGADAFAAQVQLAFQAFALSSRALMLSTIEAAAQNPGASFEGFHSRVADSLAVNAVEHQKLIDALWALSEVPVRGTKVPRPGLASRETDYRQSMLRLTRAMSSNASAPPLLTDRNTLQISAVRQGDGSFRIIEPGT